MQSPKVLNNLLLAPDMDKSPPVDKEIIPLEAESKYTNKAGVIQAEDRHNWTGVGEALGKEKVGQAETSMLSGQPSLIWRN